MTNIKIVKLVSGMELIGDCDSSPEGVKLDAAFQVVVQPVSETQFSMGLAPISVAVEGADKGLLVTRPWSDVLGVYPPTSGLSETYQRMTGTIVTPAISPIRPVLVK